MKTREVLIEELSRTPVEDAYCVSKNPLFGIILDLFIEAGHKKPEEVDGIEYRQFEEAHQKVFKPEWVTYGD